MVPFSGPCDDVESGRHEGANVPVRRPGAKISLLSGPRASAFGSTSLLRVLAAHAAGADVDHRAMSMSVASRTAVPFVRSMRKRGSCPSVHQRTSSNTVLSFSAIKHACERESGRHRRRTRARGWGTSRRTAARHRRCRTWRCSWSPSRTHAAERAGDDAHLAADAHRRVELDEVGAVARVCMAPVGQMLTHAASSHCWHIRGTENPSRSHVNVCTRVAPGRKRPSCSNEHASSQFRHPVHLSGWIISTLAMTHSFSSRREPHVELRCCGDSRSCPIKCRDCPGAKRVTVNAGEEVG